MSVRPQDLGGRKGFGAVPIEVDEPIYHAPWEGSVIAATLTTIMRGIYNVDQWRAGIDDLDPLSYMGVGYYGRWLHTLEVNCVHAGLFSEEDVERRLAEIGERPEAGSPQRDDPQLLADLQQLVRQGASNRRDVQAEPRFAAGDRVRARELPGERHARSPGYAQGKVGIIERNHGAFVFCDSHRRLEGENPAYVYAVRFGSRNLWPDGDDGVTVLADLWEPYLDPA